MLTFQFYLNRQVFTHIINLPLSVSWIISSWKYFPQQISNIVIRTLIIKLKKGYGKGTNYIHMWRSFKKFKTLIRFSICDKSLIFGRAWPTRHLKQKSEVFFRILQVVVCCHNKKKKKFSYDSSFWVRLRTFWTNFVYMNKKSLTNVVLWSRKYKYIYIYIYTLSSTDRLFRCITTLQWG